MLVDRPNVREDRADLGRRFKLTPTLNGRIGRCSRSLLRFRTFSAATQPHCSLSIKGFGDKSRYIRKSMCNSYRRRPSSCRSHRMSLMMTDMHTILRTQQQKPRRKRQGNEPNQCEC